jgi:hypothetical protein
MPHTLEVLAERAKGSSEAEVRSLQAARLDKALSRFLGVIDHERQAHLAAQDYLTPAELNHATNAVWSAVTSARDAFKRETGR